MLVWDINRFDISLDSTDEGNILPLRILGDFLERETKWLEKEICAGYILTSSRRSDLEPISEENCQKHW
jgi:hypothetical protein